jgi:DNA-binding FadR family transcriptional regulator
MHFNSVLFPQHRAIVAALRNRDPDLTRELIRAHLLSVKKSFGGF